MDTLCTTVPTETQTSPVIKGRLKQHLDFWQYNLKASSFVLNIIEHGYILPFLNFPPPFHAKNNASSLRNRKFVDKAITDLLDKGMIEELESRPYICNPLTVAEGKKLRLVLDLRHVNKYLIVQRFKYEDLKTIAEMLGEREFFTTFDLVSGYHHVEINKEHHKFLGFEWEFLDRRKRFFQFLVLAFGLASACYIFTKLLRPLIKKWRSLGIKSVIYLDDGINGHSSYNLCKTATEQIISDLNKSGFVINYEKSDFEPKQVGEWLGTIINTKNMTFYIPERKIEKLKNIIESTVNEKLTNAKTLSKIAGQLSSMHLSLGPVVRLFTRNIYIDIESKSTWYEKFDISDGCKSDLIFWLQNIDLRNGYSLKPKQSSSQILFTDASEKSYGGYIFERLEQKICFGSFTNFEVSRSSTERELLAIKYALESFSHLCKHESINVRTDNLSASKILEIGSSKPWLNKVALDIFQLCVKNDIKINPTWIPRELNKVADKFSKMKDTDDWSIDKTSFNTVIKIFGDVDFDRFAKNINKKAQNFNSKFYCPETSGVDAFTKDWSHCNLNWLCPPISLISATIEHLRNCHGKGILIAPEWPSSYFWPTLSYSKSFKPFVKHVYAFEPYYHSDCEDTIFKGFVKFRTLALYLDFSQII